MPDSTPLFTQVVMDLITGLPKSWGYNSILTIVNHRCSRGAIFLPCQSTITGPQIAKMYYQHLYPWFGLLCCLITDRDLHFTLHFGKALAKKLGVTWNLSMAYHPQTDGLSEWKNQWLKQFLQLIAINQADWPTMLALTTLVHNNTWNLTTGYALNQLITGLEPAVIPDWAEGSDNLLAETQVDQLRQQQILAANALNHATNSQTPSGNVFRNRQKVWLKAKNLALPYSSLKLASQCHGPFEITQVISPVMYRLALPPQWTIHPIFHASLLTPYVETIEHGENYLRPPLDLIGGKEQYKVEAIKSHWHHGKQKQLQYLIKWKGYPESDNTWEPAANLQAPQLLKEYHHQCPLENIRIVRVQSSKAQLPSWLLPTTHTATISLTPLHPGSNSRHLPETWMTTPLNHLPHPQITAGATTTRKRGSPNPSNTSTPMPPFAETPSASIIDKGCLKYSTPHNALNPLPPLLCHILISPHRRTTPKIWATPLTSTSPTPPSPSKLNCYDSTPIFHFPYSRDPMCP
jgi:hypothetical protein